MISFRKVNFLQKLDGFNKILGYLQYQTNYRALEASANPNSRSVKYV